jgi:hypothetical protein
MSEKQSSSSDLSPFHQSKSLASEAMIVAPLKEARKMLFGLLITHVKRLVDVNILGSEHADGLEKYDGVEIDPLNPPDLNFFEQYPLLYRLWVHLLNEIQRGNAEIPELKPALKEMSDPGRLKRYGHNAESRGSSIIRNFGAIAAIITLVIIGIGGVLVSRSLKEAQDKISVWEDKATSLERDLQPFRDALLKASTEDVSPVSRTLPSSNSPKEQVSTLSPILPEVHIEEPAVHLDLFKLTLTEDLQFPAAAQLLGVGMKYTNDYNEQRKQLMTAIMNMPGNNQVVILAATTAVGREISEEESMKLTTGITESIILPEIRDLLEIYQKNIPEDAKRRMLITAIFSMDVNQQILTRLLRELVS